MADDDALASIMDITGVSPEVARGLFQISGNDVMQACSLFFDNPEIVNALPTSQAPTAAPASRPPAAATSRRGREDPAGVIHIDSDDDDDVEMGGTPGHVLDTDSDDDFTTATAAARNAQEDEDAAYARRLQEELYGNGGAGGAAGFDDDVRAPIARTTETLVHSGPVPGLFGGHGGELHEDAEAFMEEMRRRRREVQASGAFRAGRANPFGQSVWDDGPPGASPAAAAEPSGSATSRRLAELYRPPREILTHLDWDDTREEGKDQKKWILVNLQDMTDFRCQMLNRDVWKDEGVQALVRDRFLFLQYDKDMGNARQYITLYLPNEQHQVQSNYPHIAVVDPRTGEQMKVWSGVDCPTQAVDVLRELEEFLERYRFSGKNPVATTRPPKTRNVDVDRMTEDEMLQLAMQNSLDTANGGSSGSSSRPSVMDPDELTKVVDKGKQKDEESVKAEEEKPAEVEEEGHKLDPRFAGVASDKPQTEPAPGPGVTRIQFMHPGGRVVRRFNAQDPVRTVYEWLKAEPLGGPERAGVEFEVKLVGQTKDLLEDLDNTIEEAGIKQSTLAVEYIEG